MIILYLSLLFIISSYHSNNINIIGQVTFIDYRDVKLTDLRTASFTTVATYSFN